MTRENAKSLLPIIQAYTEGKTIQMMTPTGWEDTTDELDFGCIPQVYRIKPEPREWWIVKSMSGSDLAYGSKPISASVDSIHVREVLE